MTYHFVSIIEKRKRTEGSLLCGLMRVEYWWDPDPSANMRLWRKESKDEMSTEAVDIWRWSRSERHGSVVVKFRAGSMPSPLGMLTALSCLLQDDKCQRQSAVHPAEASVSRSVQLHLPFKQKWEKSRGPVYKRAIDHFFLAFLFVVLFSIPR